MMQDHQQVSERDYSTLVDTDHDPVSDTTVFRIDAHVVDPDADRPAQYHPPDLTPETFSDLVALLEKLDRPDLAAVMETRVRQLEDNASPLYFTASSLSELAIVLSIGITKSDLLDQLDVSYAVRQFGNAIQWSLETPQLAESAQYSEIPRLKPTGSRSYINPFDVIAGSQSVEFVDNHGEPLQ